MLKKSLVLIMCFVSTFILVKSDGTVIHIKIPKGKHCTVHPNSTLNVGSNFTLKVTSDFYIDIERSRFKKNEKALTFKQLNDTYFRCKFEIWIPSNDSFSLRCLLKHTQEVVNNEGGRWDFTFYVYEDNANFPFHNKENSKESYCTTTVFIESAHGSEGSESAHGSEGSAAEIQPGGKTVDLAMVLVPIAGIMLIAQTVYIIYFRTNGCKRIWHRSESAENVCNKRKECANNIAERPPLPLPPNAIINEGFTESPRSPGSIRCRPSAPPPPSPPVPMKTCENTYKHSHRVPMSPKLPSRRNVPDPSGPVSSPVPVRYHFGSRKMPSSSPETPMPSAPVASFNKPPPARMLMPPVRSPSAPSRHFTEAATSALERGLQRRNTDFTPSVIPPPRIDKDYNGRVHEIPPPLTPKPIKTPVFRPVQRKEWQGSSSDEDWDYEKLQPNDSYIKNIYDDI